MKRGLPNLGVICGGVLFIVLAGMAQSPLPGPGISSAGGGGGSGTVTSVSVTTANGVSGTVATATSTPAISLTLGAITPTSVNGLTLTGTAASTLNFQKGHGLTGVTGAEATLTAINMPAMTTDSTCVIHAFFAKSTGTSTWELNGRLTNEAGSVIFGGPTFLLTTISAELVLYVSNASASVQNSGGYFNTSTTSGGSLGVAINSNGSGATIIPTTLNLASAWVLDITGQTSGADTLNGSSYTVNCVI